MNAPPEHVIRKYLDQNGGQAEARVEHLLTSFGVDATDEQGRERIAESLAIAGVEVDRPLAGLDPQVEWQPAIQVLLAGEDTVYQGHQGVRDLFRDVDTAFAELHVEVIEIRDLGDQIVASGRIQAPGRAGGAEADSPIGYLVDFRNGKAIRVRTFLDPREALEAVGPAE